MLYSEPDIMLNLIQRGRQFIRSVKFSSSGSVIQENLSYSEYAQLEKFSSESELIAHEFLKLKTDESLKYVTQYTLPLPHGGEITFQNLTILTDNYNYSSLKVLKVEDSNLNSSKILFNETYVMLLDYGVFKNNTIWFTCENNTRDSKLIMIDVERNYNDYSTEATLNFKQSYDQFSKIDQSQLFDDILKSIPLTDDRLKIFGVRRNPINSNETQIVFSIIKANNPSNNPGVDDIIKELNILIKHKDIISFSDKENMNSLDSEYGFQITRM
ncbi:5242_t:CDS:2 [Racocetra persica]|uniref:5242_t:CDS:1 n=1 Tax=Racocetra persica TaxID=160502 RepID=A0ACA9KT09_9GLOM|nr:5242_t:CDS:2 [Racocetra persica]